MKKISIIIPAYNEEESLPFLYERLDKLMNEIKNYEFEVLFVNDGSKDNTMKIIKELRGKDKRICYVDFSRNFGKEIAMLAGLDYAKGDAVIFMDADLQDPPELIPELIKYWEEGYDDVYARRKSREGETWLKKFTSKMYYKVLQGLTRVPIQKDTGDFRLLDRRCVNALKKLRESQRCSKSMFSWIGYNKKEVLYDRDPRIAGKTKWNYRKLIDLAIDGITSFTTSPLRVSTYLAIPTFMLLAVYFIYVIAKSIALGIAVQAFQAIILLILFFSGIQIMLFRNSRRISRKNIQRNEKQTTILCKRIQRRKRNKRITSRALAMGTVRNRKQDREELQETNKNNLARLGTVPIAETKKKI